MKNKKEEIKLGEKVYSVNDESRNSFRLISVMAILFIGSAAIFYGFMILVDTFTVAPTELAKKFCSDPITKEGKTYCIASNGEVKEFLCNKTSCGYINEKSVVSSP